MSLQYIADHKGHITGVFIPIQEWETIREKLHLPKADTKEIHRQELLESFEQMRQIRAGKLPKPDLNDFLNEL